MGNLSIQDLWTEMRGFLKNEYRIDPLYRFCLTFSQYGDLFHYLTHDHTLNPEARPLGSREDEKGAYAQALMQLLISIIVLKYSLTDIFNKAFKMDSKRIHTIEEVEKSTKYPPTLSPVVMMQSALEIINSTNKLVRNPSIDLAAKSLRALSFYIADRGLSFKEVIYMGLDNQRSRDWAIQKAKKTNDNNKLLGTIGVPGEISGIAYVVSENNPISNFPVGGILVIENARPEHILEVSRANGAISNNGGIGCHLMNMAREKNIPCLIATGNATQRIKHGQEITIHALCEPGYVQL